MAKEFLGEQTLSKLIQMISTEFKKYVKNTDYATDTKAGVVKVNGNRGMAVLTGGIIAPKPPTTKLIDKRNNGTDPPQFTALTLNRIDYAIKAGITTNTIELTDDEKTAAQTWLGVTDQLGDIETALDGIITIQNELIGGDTV